MEKKDIKKIVIFDWGGVIESHNLNYYNRFDVFNDIFRDFGSSFNKHDPNEIQRLYDCQRFDNINIFEIDNLEELEPWFDNIKNNFKLNCNYIEFLKAYKKHFDKVYYYSNIVEFAHSLKEKNICKIGVLSNLCLFDKERIDKQLNLEKFDYVWLSYELKTSKPKSSIYEIVENDLNDKKYQILFIDDNKTNIETALSRGWKTINTTGENYLKIKSNVLKFVDNNNL